MRHLKLVRNMRAQSDLLFADYLLRIGGGTEEVNEDGNVRIPDEICVMYSGDAEKDLHTLIDIIFSRSKCKHGEQRLHHHQSDFIYT